MNKWVEILIGLILLILVVIFCGLNLGGFGISALIFLKGGLVWLIILAGILLLIIGINDLKG